MKSFYKVYLMYAFVFFCNLLKINYNKWILL